MRTMTLLRNRLSLVAGVGLTALLCSSSPALAQTAGNAQSFAIVGGTGVNANGSGSLVSGNVGISPAAATFITGFPANATIVPPFVNHGNDAFAIAAEASALTLYNSAAMAPAGGTPTGANLSISGPLSNGHYTPGKYFVNSGSALLTVAGITLDGPGLYIFTVNSDLTAAVGSSIILNGVDPCNVWWRVPTNATLNGTFFAGTVVSNSVIALGTGATLTGRALTTASGSVTLAGNDVIGGCSAAQPPITLSPPTLPNGTLGVAFNQTITASGGTAPFTFAVTAGALPAGLTLTPGGVLAGTPTTAGTSTFTITATDAGGNPASLSYTLIIAAPVPTLSQWAMIALMLLLALAGFTAMGRRKTT